MTILDNITQSDVFVAYKKEGETPLECLNRLKDEGFLPYNDKFTYAGRLDPMAEGLLMFLRGEAIKNKHHFLSLDKVYEVEVLLGISTDTGDILGLINSVVHGGVAFDLKNVNNICESFVGETDVPYPWFSSRTLNGKPLFEWAREFASEEDNGDEGAKEGNIEGDNKVNNEDRNEDKIEGTEILLRPMTKLSIKEIEFLDLSLISNKDLLDNVIQRIKKIKGDFRQERILQEWDKVSLKKTSKNPKENIKNFKSNEDEEYPLLKIRVKCGSGSYMRTLSELIGERLKVPALAYSIKRLSIGEYRI
jgi:tRNA U55 pseudouridine synthase TruB